MSGVPKRLIQDFFTKYSAKRKKDNLDVDNDLMEIQDSEDDAVGPSGVENVSNSDICLECPSDIAKSLSDGPRQPVLDQFQQRKFGQEMRSFQADWYRVYPWLEYSVLHDAAFCFACRMFSNEGKVGRSKFIKEGYSYWKKALSNNSGLKKHENSEVHKTSSVCWEQYRHMKEKGKETSVVTMLSEVYTAEVQENRVYIAKIAEVLLFTAVQGIAQRGHDVSETSDNRGNFLELLNLMSKYDPTLKKKLSSGPQNAKYVHPSIQNEILNILANATLEVIRNDVNRAKYFSLMVDESKDISKTEQLSVVVRFYLDNKIYERFLGFHPAKFLDAASLLKYVKETLCNCGINIQNCIAQTYDGANVMKGSVNGVQSLFRKEVPQAVYIHCMNHRLNLVIVDVCKNVKSAYNFFLILQKLYVFMSGSVTHSLFINVQLEMGKSVIELKALSDTRWTCQVAACDAVKKTLPAILVTLSKIEGSNGSRSPEAHGLFNEINMEFVVHLCIFKNILMELKIVSDFLQKKDCDIGRGCMLVESTSNRLMKLRESKEEFVEIWNEAFSLISETGINAEIDQRPYRSRRLPQHLAKFVITENIANEENALSTQEDFRKHAFLPILDKINAELERRFTVNNPILKAMGCLNPGSDKFLDLSLLKPLVNHYGSDMESVELEVKLLRKTLERYQEENKIKVDDIFKIVKFLEEYKVAFHEMYKLTVIAITTPASSAGCERTFSCQRLLKTYLRNRMGDERLSNLAVLAIEKDIAKALDLQDIISRFDAAHANRRINLH